MSTIIDEDKLIASGCEFIACALLSYQHCIVIVLLLYCCCIVVIVVVVVIVVLVYAIVVCRISSLFLWSRSSLMSLSTISTSLASVPYLSHVCYSRHHGDGTYHHASYICLLLTTMQSWTPSAPTRTQSTAAARRVEPLKENDGCGKDRWMSPPPDLFIRQVRRIKGGDTRRIR